MAHLPFDQDRFNTDVHRRVKLLERLAGRSNRPDTEEIATFSVVGDMEVRTSGKYRVRVGGQITAVTYQATAAGTGTTDFDILLNGSALGSGVSIASGTTEGVVYLGNYRAKNGDTLQLDITAAGMHPDLVVHVICKG